MTERHQSFEVVLTYVTFWDALERLYVLAYLPILGVGLRRDRQLMRCYGYQDYGKEERTIIGMLDRPDTSAMVFCP